MRTLMLAATALTPLAASVAAAADLEGRSRIDRVTVYPDAALVTRVMEIDLPAGASTVLLRGLPYALDPASLRVAGEGSAAIGIGAVEARLAPADTKTETAVEARLRSLRSDREGWQSTIDALTVKSEMIKRFAQASPERLSADSKPLEIAQWNSAFDTVGAGLAKVGDELRAARTRLRDIDDEIKAVEASRPRQQGKPPLRDISIALEATGATKAKLAVSYRVGGASWRPAYDAKLDTGGASRKPALELVRRAQVFQRTGEDWSDVALAVSTTRALRGSQAPEVQPERIAFWERPVPTASGGLRREAPMAKNMQMDAAKPASSVAAAPPPVVAEERKADLQADAWQANFVVPGRISVPADGAMKNFALGAKRYEPALIVKTSPSLDPTAYLEAHLENAEEAPLLPGSVSVQRDGAFVGQGWLGMVAPGDEFDLGFGADDRVKVTRAPLKRKENEPTWYNQSKIDQRDFKTSVKSLHDFPIKAVVVDRIPFSENSAITVELLSQTTPPTDKQVGDKRGVMSWTFDLKPGEQKDIRLAWRMKWPADRDVVFQPAPNPR
ncbi:MAG: mucoidy inhibitor MuiA family protein [Rhodoblastus sp.]|nr:mucoidy inhibitor MuiA family protein [Rhodoblastus sp.]